LTVLNWIYDEHGWRFGPEGRGDLDPEIGAERLHQLYTASDPSFTGRATVPVLWDRERQVIVSNESADIIRMFNSAFDDIGAEPGDWYPHHLRPEIDRTNQIIYRGLNNAVYRAGFATSQEGYNEAASEVFETLDWLEELLSTRARVCGRRETEADWRLFTTLIRFDHVYHGHFRCDRRRIVDYPAIWSYTRELFQRRGVRETFDLMQIREHYYLSHPRLNPSGIVPLGPELNLEAPPTRRLEVRVSA
jgi:putative glutathione S-transferase